MTMTIERVRIKTPAGGTAYVLDEYGVRFAPAQSGHGGATLAALLEDQIAPAGGTWHKTRGRNTATLRLCEEARRAARELRGEPFFFCYGFLFLKAQDGEGREFAYSLIDGEPFASRGLTPERLHSHFRDFLDARGVVFRGQENRERRLNAAIDSGDAPVELVHGEKVDFFKSLNVFWVEVGGRRYFADVQRLASIYRRVSKDLKNGK